MNILFVCTMNQWRSRTAETIFKKNNKHAIRSAGTSEQARIKLNEGLIAWADLIFAMEKKHKQIIQQKFGADKQVIVLDIPDEYEYMDPELIEILKTSVAHYLL